MPSSRRSSKPSADAAHLFQDKSKPLSQAAACAPTTAPLSASSVLLPQETEKFWQTDGTVPVGAEAGYHLLVSAFSCASQHLARWLGEEEERRAAAAPPTISTSQFVTT